MFLLINKTFAIKMLYIRTARSEQTVQSKIRLLKEQSDQAALFAISSAIFESINALKIQSLSFFLGYNKVYPLRF